VNLSLPTTSTLAYICEQGRRLPERSPLRDSTLVAALALPADSRLEEVTVGDKHNSL